MDPRDQKRLSVLDEGFSKHGTHGALGLVVREHAFIDTFMPIL